MRELVGEVEDEPGVDRAEADIVLEEVLLEELAVDLVVILVELLVVLLDLVVEVIIRVDIMHGLSDILFVLGGVDSDVVRVERGGEREVLEGLLVNLWVVEVVQEVGDFGGGEIGGKR